MFVTFTRINVLSQLMGVNQNLTFFPLSRIYFVKSVRKTNGSKPETTIGSTLNKYLGPKHM